MRPDGGDGEVGGEGEGGGGSGEGQELILSLRLARPRSVSLALHGSELWSVLSLRRAAPARETLLGLPEGRKGRFDLFKI